MHTLTKRKGREIVELQPSKRTTCLSFRGEWTLACCISCHPITGGLSVPSAHSEPQQLPSQPQRCLLASPGSLPSTLWRGFEPGKAKTMYNGASSTTHDPVMEREEYGWRGWWERKGREVEGKGWTCRHLVCGKEGWWRKVRGAC